MSVSIEKNGAVTTIILDRPDVKNAVDRTTAEALAAAFLAFENDEDASVAVFHGAHGSFCAGADLKAVSAGAGNGIPFVKQGFEFDRLAPDGPMGPSRMVLSKPVIASVSGYAVAGGMELALWCDMRVMEEDAVMGIFCRRWGVPLVDGGHGAASADDRPCARHGSDFDRTSCRGGGSVGDRACQSSGSQG